MTILYYANGGSDLDVYLLNNIRDMYLAGDQSVYDQINISVQYKNTAIFEVDKEKGYNEQYFLKLIEQVLPGFELEKGTTYRFLLDPAKGYSKEKPQMQLTDDNIYGGRGNKVNMGDENTLLDFINWAKENYPAENYMLIMNDHGGGYMPHDDQPKAASADTRGIIYDDGYGGDYKALYKELATNTDFVKAIQNYYDVLSKRWTDSDDPNAPSYDDNTLTETVELIKGAPAIKAFVDQLCDSYTNGTDNLRAYVDAVTENAFKVNNELPYYDISDYLGRIYQNEKIEKENAKLSNAAFEAYKAVIAPIRAQAASYYTDIVANYRPGYSALLAQEGIYFTTSVKYDKQDNATLLGCNGYDWNGTAQYYNVKDGKFVADGKPVSWGSTGADTYEQLLFDKLTGWSRWQKLNKAFPNYDSVVGRKWDDTYVAPNIFID